MRIHEFKGEGVHLVFTTKKVDSGVESVPLGVLRQPFTVEALREACGEDLETLYLEWVPFIEIVE